MLIDLHAHTSAISTCCRVDAEKIMQTARESGFDGLAIANHYTSTYFSEDNHAQWLERYIDEWNNCAALGEKYGLRIFKAIEVTMSYEPRIHMLIYGANEQLLRKYRFLCEKSLEELYRLCVDNGCALIQAHPYRSGATVQNTRYLHGVEVNCHPMYKNSYAEDVIAAAKAAKLAVTVGCDYHADTYRPSGATILPDTLDGDRALAEYLLTSREFELQIHEPLDKSIYKTVYRR